MPLDACNAVLPLLCRSCGARDRGICGALESDQLVRLSRHASRHEMAPGMEIVAAGAPVERYANILCGVVSLTKAMADGRQQVVGLQFAPDFVGRPFASTSDVSAEAASTVRLCSFPKAALEAMVTEAPALGHRLHRQALRELDEARDWMMTLGRKTAAERVASFLTLVGRHAGPGSGLLGARFDIPMRRADIADFLGLSLETVSRQLTGLRQAGIIDIEANRHVTVTDAVALKVAAGV